MSDATNKAAAAPEVATRDPEHVGMTKNGETIFVHASNVEHHKALGWALA